MSVYYCVFIYKSRHTSICEETNLRFDLSLWLTKETIRPLVQFACGRLLYSDVAILVAPHLFAYVLFDIRRAGRQRKR